MYGDTNVPEFLGLEGYEDHDVNVYFGRKLRRTDGESRFSDLSLGQRNRNLNKIGTLASTSRVFSPLSRGEQERHRILDRLATAAFDPTVSQRRTD
jgi:hypothetical protein